MKNIYSYIMLLVITFAVASCADDEVIEKKNQAKPGDDVQFGLSLPNSRTVSRTVYGTENTEDNITSLPVYWVDGDKVQIYSPECAAGRNDAEYSVTPKSGQSYAEKLTKTGEYGVQWGDKNVANFYSVYPSLNAKFSVSGSDVTAKLNISSTQLANLANGVGTDMDNVIMYAQTNDIAAGSTVNLKYTPYSTILQFKLTLGPSNNGWGKVRVSSLTLTAPENVAIAGDFNLKFAGGDAPTITKAGNNRNSITVTFETAPILNESNQTANINVALIPLDLTNLKGWTVSLDAYLNNDDKVTKYSMPLDGASNLKPGMIHKITMPAITPAVKWEYDLSNWIPSLYDYTNIYLTELSLPGAWYAGAKTSDGYQATQSITDLWNAGIRAFAVETKCVSKTVDLWVTTGPLATPSDVVVSGTADNASISTASGSNTLNTGSDDKIYKSGNNNITLKTIFENIISCLKTQQNNSEKKPEFAVLVLSYADGGTTGMRPVDFGAWLELLYDSYNSLSAENKKYIYSSTIDANTTVYDVLNKLIIKVNVDMNIAQGGEVVYDVLNLGIYKDQRKYSYTNNLPALLSYNPFMSQIGSDYYETPLFSKMSWKNWTDATDPYRSYSTTASSDFLWCFSSANRTKLNTGTNTTIPSYAQRQEGLRAMITHSREISSNGTHNVWFYFNAGGTQTTSQSDETTSATDFAKTMNPWLLEVINLKSNGGVDTNGNYTGTAGTIVASDPSPLGIVMFNQCTGANATYRGTDIIKAIVDMNDKFKLKRYSDEPDTDPIQPGDEEDDPFA